MDRRPQTPIQREIVVSVSAKIPRKRKFENYQPFSSIKEVYSGDTVTDDFIISRREVLRAQLDKELEALREKILHDGDLKPEKKPDTLMCPKCGLPHYRVTHIISIDQQFYVSDEDLNEYAVRGTIMHEAFDHWMDTTRWVLPGNHNPLMQKLIKGRLNLQETLKKFNWLGFWEKYGEDMLFESGFRGWNCTLQITGELDAIGTYKGERAIFDLKSRGWFEKDWKQKAGYTLLNDERVKDVKWLVTLPLNSKNKSGYAAPKATQDIEKYRKMFLEDFIAYKEHWRIK